MPDGNIWGSGMKFPPRINPATGRFEVAEGKESVKESVYLILMTQVNERIMRPDFGSNLMSYAFMDVNVTTINIMLRSLVTQIQSQEPRVRDVEITLDPESEDSCLILNIDYVLRENNTRDNLVFPFYLNAASEEEEAYEPEQDESEDREETEY